MRSRLGPSAACALAIGLAFAPGVRAAHPLQTEDTGTQGTGNVEWENGFTRGWPAGGGDSFVYQPQISFGATPALDLIVQPAWLWHRDGHGDLVHGLGDTNLDLKWRFHGQAPLSLAVRAGTAVATSEHGQGLRHGTYSPHAVLVGTFEWAPLTLHANLGISENPSSSGLRRTVTAVSAAAMWSIDEKLVLTGEWVVASNPDPLRDPHVRTVLAGAIYTLRPGLDLDLGWQHTGGGTPSANALLFGVTYRFGL